MPRVEWARANGALLNETERDFLTASVDESARIAAPPAEGQPPAPPRADGSRGVSSSPRWRCSCSRSSSRHDAVRSGGDQHGPRRSPPRRRARSGATRNARCCWRGSRCTIAPTPDAELAASEALDANTVRSQLPSFGPQGCHDVEFPVPVRPRTDRGRQHLRRARRLRRPRRQARSSGACASGRARPTWSSGPTGRTLIVATGRNLVSVDVRSRACQPHLHRPVPDHARRRSARRVPRDRRR